MSNISGFVKRIRDIMRNDQGISGDGQRLEQLSWLLFLKIYDTKEADWEFNDDGYESIIPEMCRWRNWASNEDGHAMTDKELLNFVNNILLPVLNGKDVRNGDEIVCSGIYVDEKTPIRQAIVRSAFVDTNNYMKNGILLRQVIDVIDELDLTDDEESHMFGEIYETILRELQSAGTDGEYYTPRAVTDFMAYIIKPQLGEVCADFACGTGGFLVSWLKELWKQVKSTDDILLYNNSIYGIEKKAFPYMLCVSNLLLHDIDSPNVEHKDSLMQNVLDYSDSDKFDVILMNPPYGGSELDEVKNCFPADISSSETADLFMDVIMYRLKENGRVAVILPNGFLFGEGNAKVNIKKKLLSEFNLHTIVRLPDSVFAPYTSISTSILFFDKTGSTQDVWIYRLDMPEGYRHFSKTKPMRFEHFKPVIDWWDNRTEISVDGVPKVKKYSAAEIKERNYNLDLCGFPHDEEEILPPQDVIREYTERKASLDADIASVLGKIMAMLGGDGEDD